jgi:hypothetical protein
VKAELAGEMRGLRDEMIVALANIAKVKELLAAERVALADVLPNPLQRSRGLN